MASVQNVSLNIRQMREALDRVIENGKEIGEFNDGPVLRSSINTDVNKIVNLSKSIKNDIVSLRQAGNTEIDQYEKQFDELSKFMKENLPPVVSRMKRYQQEEKRSTSETTITSNLISEQEVDDMTDRIDALEQSVQEILSTMREVQSIFQQTLEELQKQRHIIMAVDSKIEEAHESTKKGNEHLDAAHQHQKGSTKCMCWIAIFFTIVVLGVVIFLCVKFIPSGSGKNPDPPSNKTMSINYNFNYN